MTFLLFLACARDIRDLDGDGTLDVAVPDTATADTDTASPEQDPAPALDRVTVTTLDDGSHLVDVDSREGVTHVDLGGPAQVLPDEGWELSLERYFFRVNGGVMGDGGVEVANLGEVAWDEVDRAPEVGWTTETDESAPLEDWYVYDSVEHVLYAAPIVYALRNAAGEAWKLQIVDYYDSFGNTGFPSFRVAPLALPSAARSAASTPSTTGIAPDGSPTRAWVAQAPPLTVPRWSSPRRRR